MANGSPVISWRTRETRMFGDVPTSVTMPPSSEPNAIGIRSIEGEVSFFRASWNATGISIASAPMFFTNPESKATVPVSTITCAPVFVSQGASGLSKRSTIPERATAALTTSALAMIAMMSSENPENALSAGTKPISTATSRVTIATRS